MDDLYWDPFDVEIDTEPYGIWRRLRDEAPVYRNDKHDFWAFSRFDDVEAAHRDPKTFSSAHGTVLELMGPDMAATRQMIFLDPPDHTQLRSLVSRAFTPRRIGVVESRIRELCTKLLDEQSGRSRFDYLQDFGAALPPMVISSLLGVPDVEARELRHVVDRMFHIEPGVGMINETSMRANGEVSAFLHDQLKERRATPRDDLLTALVRAEITDEQGEHRRLTPSECVSFATLLYVAGTETVARLLGWAAVVLADHPDQRAELAADPALIPNAVEELLRFEAPSPVQGRWTTAVVERHGVAVPKDAKVLLLTGSAGRDERAYPDADRFDIHRDVHQHVSFGYGIHYCLGAALARTEGRIALEETLRRHPEWDVDHEHAVRLHTSTVRGYREVPIFV